MTEFTKLLLSSNLNVKRINSMAYNAIEDSLFFLLEVEDGFNQEVFIKFLREYIEDSRIIIKVEEEGKRDLCPDYIEDLFIKLTEKHPRLCSKTSGISMSLRGEVIHIEVPNQMTLEFIQTSDILQIIKDQVRAQCGLEPEVELINVDKGDLDTVLEENEKIEIERQKKVMAQSPRPIKREKVEELVRIGKKIDEEPIAIGSLDGDSHLVTISGEVFNIEARPIRNERYIVSFYIFDGTGASSCKAFWSKELYERFIQGISEGSQVIVSGNYGVDSYDNCYVLVISKLEETDRVKRLDLAEDKRVELRCHSQMSELNGFASIKDLYKRLAKWGHRGMALTDQGVVQAFPDTVKPSADSGIKTILGMDATIIEDYLPIVLDYRGEKESYVVYDIETTGLAQSYDSITEIGAVKIIDGRVVETFGQLVKPEIRIEEKITELTGITNEMVANAPPIEEVFPQFVEFIGDSILVAHNAEFDIGFLKENANNLGYKFDYSYIDTLFLARFLYSDLRNHRLNTLARRFGVSLENHHRAVDDATATGEIFIKMLDDLNQLGLKLNDDLNYMECGWNPADTTEYNGLILVKNQVGLKNLYHIVTDSHLNKLGRGPRVSKAYLAEHREGLLLGSGNMMGELFLAIKNHTSQEEIIDIANTFDFLEVQPRENYRYLIENSDDRMGFKSLEQVDEINEKIVQLGEDLEIPVVATGDMFFLDKGQEIFRDIVQSFQRRRRVKTSEEQFLKTTDEMLESFSFLGKEKAYEIVVENTNMILDLVEDVRPIPKGKFPPEMAGAEEELRSVCYENARKIYGEDLPGLIKDRLETELSSIIDNGYAGLYIIARKLVVQSNEDGYEVGSRGSVGSSFAATMAGITEVNPLAPHYICSECKKSEFVDETLYFSGVDLPDKACECGGTMKGEGHNIPFEVFLGFGGGKEPDIDLNFAREYQSICHKYVEELFGSESVFRAGTTGTIQKDTAYGHILNYCELTGTHYNGAEIAYLQRGIEGVKRSSGQHPGGIMIIPKGMNIEDFTPINYPANDPNSGVVTTHFSYRALENTILKLDLLGHVVPSTYRMLEDMTGIDPMSLPMGDEETMKIFSSQESLGLENPEEGGVATLGVPEFGTDFVMEMLKETRPTSFGELVRISGLSHGTDVWTTNAQELVRNKEAVLAEVISTRDDIMTFLIQKGMEPSLAFSTMESVRRGNGLTKEMEDAMSKIDLPSWYVDSCKKIKYMFPKAHAVAYVLASYRVAYFKVHYPASFYASYFNSRLNDFQEVLLKGLGPIRAEIENIRFENRGKRMSASDQNKLGVLLIGEEMYLRGIEIEPVTLDGSREQSFFPSSERKIRPPFCALGGISQQASIDIYNEYAKGDFISIEDLRQRTGVNKNALDSLREAGCLDKLQNTNQVDLFSLLD